MTSSRFLVLGVVSFALGAVRPAPACQVVKFQIVGGLEDSGNVIAGHRVDFQVWFDRPVVDGKVLRGTQVGSLRMDFGDGTVEDTGVKTFDAPSTYDFGGATWTFFLHEYKKVGTFTASLTGGGVQPCAMDGGLSYRIPVVSDMTDMTKAKRSMTIPPADDRLKTPVKPKTAVLLVPTPPAYVAAGRASAATRSLGSVIYGRVTGASVSYSVYGNVLSVDGDGRCALKVFETMAGRPLRTYDYKGPLPTKVTMLSTLPGIHVLKVEGDKSSESCGGTASASGAVALK